MAKDLSDLYKKIGNVGSTLEQVAMAKLLLAGEIIRTQAVTSIQQQSPGHPVTRYTAGGNPYAHNAANSGFPPNTDTGNLVKNIKTEQRGKDSVVVGSFEAAPYGKWLEIGNEKGQKWPWLNPAYKAVESKIKAMFGKIGIEVMKTA